MSRFSLLPRVIIIPAVSRKYTGIRRMVLDRAQHQEFDQIRPERWIEHLQRSENVDDDTDIVRSRGPLQIVTSHAVRDTVRRGNNGRAIKAITFAFHAVATYHVTHLSCPRIDIQNRTGHTADVHEFRRSVFLHERLPVVRVDQAEVHEKRRRLDPDTEDLGLQILKVRCAYLILIFGFQ